MDNQIVVTARYVLTAVASYGVGKGWFTAAQAGDLVNLGINAGVALVPLAMTVWAVLKSSKIARSGAVQASPTEQVITTDPAVAAANPGVKLALPGQQVTVTAPIAASKL